jgi:hypothetical protein
MLRLTIVLAFAFALSLLGCTKEEKLTEVKGTLYIGDQPAKSAEGDKTEGFITFHPDASKGNTWQEEAVGHVKPDGTYELDMRGKKGAAKGWYQVGVTYADVIDPNNPYVSNWRMPNPEKYQYWSKSGIAVEIVDNPQPGQYDIKLPPLKTGTN